jgi:hypothetical protein
MGETEKKEKKAASAMVKLAGLQAVRLRVKPTERKDMISLERLVDMVTLKSHRRVMSGSTASLKQAKSTRLGRIQIKGPPDQRKAQQGSHCYPPCLRPTASTI